MSTMTSRYPSVQSGKLPDFTASALHDLQWMEQVRLLVASAAKFVDRYKKAKQSWAVPVPFSFDAQFDALWENQGRPDAEYDRLRKKYPMDAVALDQLAEVLPAITQRAVQSIRCRRLLRTDATLKGNLDLIRLRLPQLSHLMGLFDLADEITLSIELPKQSLRLHYYLEGIENWNHLQALLRADWQEEEALAMYRGQVLSPASIEYFRGERLEPTDEVIESTWGWHTVARNGNAPTSLPVQKNWLFGEQSPKKLPVDDGVRYVSASVPPFPSAFDVERQYPGLKSSIRLLVSEEMQPLPITQPRLQAA